MKFLPLVFALLFLLLPTGCTLARYNTKPPAATASAGSTSVNQTGEAAKPATAATNTQSATVPLPAGSNVEFNEKLGTWTFKLSADTTLKTECRAETVTAPQAFTPPAPPTPADEAKGKAALCLRLGLAAGLAAGVFGLVRGWDLVAIGGGSVAAACFVGLSIEVIPVWLWVLSGVGGALAVIGPTLWHLRLKHVSIKT